MDCDLCLQYIKVRKLFKGGNYLRAETIRGNTVVYSLIIQPAPNKGTKPITIFFKSDIKV